MLAALGALCEWVQRYILTMLKANVNAGIGLWRPLVSRVWWIG